MYDKAGGPPGFTCTPTRLIIVFIYYKCLNTSKSDIKDGLKTLTGETVGITIATWSTFFSSTFYLERQ